MNEKNVLYQLKLCEETSRQRREQFRIFEFFLVNYDHQSTVQEAVTYNSQAVLLIQAANQLEDLIGREIELAKGSMKKLQDLPDDEQWEYRFAYTLGVTEALNKMGTLQNQLREHTQSALHKASLLSLSANGKSALPTHSAGLDDDIHTFEDEASPKWKETMKEICRLGLSLAKVFYKDAHARESEQPLTIASICSNARDLTTSSLLVALGNIVTELLSNKHPVKAETKEQWFTAQATAAGILAGLITEVVQKNRPLLAISWN